MLKMHVLEKSVPHTEANSPPLSFGSHIFLEEIFYL
jgi:hypothetical protein